MKRDLDEKVFMEEEGKIFDKIGWFILWLPYISICFMLFSIVTTGLIFIVGVIGFLFISPIMNIVYFIIYYKKEKITPMLICMGNIVLTVGMLIFVIIEMNKGFYSPW